MRTPFPSVSGEPVVRAIAPNATWRSAAGSGASTFSLRSMVLPTKSPNGSLLALRRSRRQAVHAHVGADVQWCRPGADRMLGGDHAKTLGQGIERAALRPSSTNHVNGVGPLSGAASQFFAGESRAN